MDSSDPSTGRMVSLSSGEEAVFICGNARRAAQAIVKDIGGVAGTII